MALVRPALKIGIASSAATLVKRAAPRPTPLSSSPGGRTARRRTAAGTIPPWLGDGARWPLRAARFSARRSGRRCSSVAGWPGCGDGTTTAPLRARWLAALKAWSPISTAMRWRDTAASVSSGGIAARARDASVCARSTSNGVARPDALARGDQAQRLVLRGGDRTHGVELAQRAGEDEVVGRDVAQHEQAHAALAVLGRHRVGCRGLGAGAQAAGDIDFPGDVEPGAGGLACPAGALDRAAVAAAAIGTAGAEADARHQPRAADGFAGARCAHALGGDLDVAILARRAADQLGQHRVAVALPPRDFRLAHSCGRGVAVAVAAAANCGGTSTADLSTGVEHPASASTASAASVAFVIRDGLPKRFVSRRAREGRCVVRAGRCMGSLTRVEFRSRSSVMNASNEVVAEASAIGRGLVSGR